MVIRLIFLRGAGIRLKDNAEDMTSDVAFRNVSYDSRGGRSEGVSTQPFLNLPCRCHCDTPQFL